MKVQDSINDLSGESRGDHCLLLSHSGPVTVSSLEGEGERQSPTDLRRLVFVMMAVWELKMASMKFSPGCMPVLLGGRPRFDVLWLLLCALALLSLSPASVRGEDTCVVSPGSLPLPYGWNCIFNEKGTRRIDIWSPWYEEGAFINAYIQAIRAVAKNNLSFRFIFTIKSWGGKVPAYPAYRDELTTALRGDAEEAPELFAIGTRQLGYLRGEGLLKDISKRWTEVDEEKLNAVVIPNIKQLWGPDDGESSPLSLCRPYRTSVRDPYFDGGLSDANVDVGIGGLIKVFFGGFNRPH